MIATGNSNPGSLYFVTKKYNRIFRKIASIHNLNVILEAVEHVNQRLSPS